MKQKTLILVIVPMSDFQSLKIVLNNFWINFVVLQIKLHFFTFEITAKFKVIK